MFAPLVTLVQVHVSTKLQVSTAFLFREKRRQGRTDRRTELNAAPREGRLISVSGSYCLQRSITTLY